MMPVLLALLLSVVCLEAQTRPPAPPAREPLAVLATGPSYGKGVWQLGPNALEYIYGEYRYRGMKVAVQYLRLAVPPLTGWKKEACGPLVLHRLPAAGEELLCYTDEAFWSVFMSFPAGTTDLCRFIDPFIKRLTFFVRAVELGAEPPGASPLPAILESR
jgi:hypothetical protein